MTAAIRENLVKLLPCNFAEIMKYFEKKFKLESQSFREKCSYHGDSLKLPVHLFPRILHN